MFFDYSQRKTVLKWSYVTSLIGLTAFRHQALYFSSIHEFAKTQTKSRNNASKKKVSKTDGIKFPCHQCDKQYTAKSKLTRHIQSVHEGVKYTCNQCGKQYTGQGNLITHILSQHEGVKQY